MKSVNTFGIHFIVRASKAKNGKVPIYARIVVNSKRVEVSLKRWINSDGWNSAKGMAKPRTPELKLLNNFLEQVRSVITGHYSELSIAAETITPEILKMKFLGVEEKEKPTLCEALSYHNSNMAHVLAPGTLKNYTTTEKYIKGFLASRNKSDIEFRYLDYRFITEFEMFLRAHQPTDHQKKLGNNGVMKHMERFQKICNLAVKMSWLDKSPFAMFQLKFQRTERGYLTQEEVDTVAKKEFVISRMCFVRDLFIFSCYTGLSYVDVMNLTPDNIVIGIDGTDWIKTSRQKTTTIVNVPLLNRPRDIISQYANDPRALYRGKLFPAISNQKLNSYLKELATVCGISKNFTFHLARHTFATTITLSNGVPIESVGKMLGHKKMSTTQIYAKVVERKISEDMSQLRKMM